MARKAPSSRALFLPAGTQVHRGAQGSAGAMSQGRRYGRSRTWPGPVSRPLLGLTFFCASRHSDILSIITLDRCPGRSLDRSAVTPTPCGRVKRGHDQPGIPPDRRDPPCARGSAWQAPAPTTRLTRRERQKQLETWGYIFKPPCATVPLRPGDDTAAGIDYHGRHCR